MARPPIASEVEAKLATLEKSGQNCSSLSRRAIRHSETGGEGLEEVQKEFSTFQDSVKGQLSDMSALVKELLYEVQKGNGRETYPSSSQVGATVLEDAGGEEVMEGLVIASTPNVVKAQEESTLNVHVVNASTVVVNNVAIEV